MSSAERLKAARAAKGMSQDELAAATKLTQPFISLMESGYRAGSAKVWSRLASALGTSIDWLQDGIGRPPV